MCSWPFAAEYADGRDYIASALARGAAAVLWDPAEGFAWPAQWAATPNLAVPELRQRAGMVASQVLGHPSRAMLMVGITGTNGKTSISHWLAQAWTLLGRKNGVDWHSGQWVCWRTQRHHPHHA